jgi:deleted-in-malignant-brain-tumors protein 1
MFCNRILSAVNPTTSDCDDGDIRLIGGSTALEGRVEVCFSKVWGAICDSSFGPEEASVTCAQLGFQRAGKCSLIYEVLWQ